MKRAILMVALGCFAIAVTGAAPAATVTLKGGLVSGPQTTQVKALTEWSRLVKERTGGQVVIEIYPAEQLGNERALLEGINLGTIDWALIGPSSAERMAPEFGMFENAYTFRNIQHIADSAMNREFIEYLDGILGKKSNLRLLGFQWFGTRHVIADKPILSPEDGKGLKLRTPDVPAYKIACYALGATATPMAFGEVYMALSQGVIDAGECSFEQINTMKWYEIKKFITLTAHVEGMTSVFMNKRSFERKLTPEQQKIVFDSGMEVWDTFFKNYQKTNEAMMEKLKGDGITFAVPSKEQMAVFISRAHEALAQDFIPKWGETWVKFQSYAK
ncbi:MAG: TRAP transporter substrate-binding protein [Planctomycetota bacterium]|jgi:tripartite ATP-independent transporter DctP family solute receptor|nr:TRAP transporter substrate-binding protein [Planctomycetota bacterium]